MFPGKQQKQARSKEKSAFKRFVSALHLWMGLASGIIVFIVSVTGCIYVFEQEIRHYTQRYQFVTPQDQPYLPPSRIRQLTAEQVFGREADSLGKHLQNISYYTGDKAATVSYKDPRKGQVLFYVNPYDGKLLYKRYYNRDFFRIMLKGHMYLWLDPKIGKPVIATAVLLFVVLLITGLIMWWPKNLKKANANKSFKIKWSASFKRLNYDLHNVLGFYVFLAAFVIAATGLVWGFEWWAKSSYWVTSGGKSLQPLKRPFSDTATLTARYTLPEDRVWQQAREAYFPITGMIQIQLPVKTSDPIGLVHNPKEGTHYSRQFRYFDRYTLAEIKGGGVYNTPYDKAPLSDKIYRANYDIHVGAILGWPGKMLAFFASLICASLPVTGFLVWWGKKKKRPSVYPTRTKNMARCSQSLCKVSIRSL